MMAFIILPFSTRFEDSTIEILEDWGKSILQSYNLPILQSYNLTIIQSLNHSYRRAFTGFSLADLMA